MSIKFLLIDDDVQSGDAPAERYAEKLTQVSKGALTVGTYRPQSIDKVLAHIGDAKPDGLLVDVAFTNALTEEHVSIAYDGMALAQQIRTWQTRGLRQQRHKPAGISSGAPFQARCYSRIHQGRHHG